jgi:hypothetical protein
MLKQRKKLYFEESQKRREIDDWFEEKVSIEFMLERELARERTYQDELFKNQKMFDTEIFKLQELIDRKTQELDAKQ